MFGIGFSEMLMIGVVILIAVGPKRLPQLMKTVGQGVREIRRASNELRRSVGFDEMMREADVRQAIREPYKPPQRRELTANELESELPEEGVDIAEATHRAQVGLSLAATRTPAPAASAEDASDPERVGNS